MTENDNKNASKDATPPQPTREPVVVQATVPPSNQSQANLVLILVLFIILLIGAAVAFALKNNSNDTQSEKEKLKAQIVALGSGGDNLLASEASLEARVSEIVTHANNILIDYESVKQGYTNAKDLLEARENELKGNRGTITRFSETINKLQAENDKLKGLAASSKTYMEQAAMLRETLIDKDKLIASLRGGPSKESMRALQSSLDSERLSHDELQRELTALKRKMTGMVDSEKVRNLEALRRENEELRNRLAALQAKADFSKLFVKSHEQLPLQAQALYNELRQLENASPTALADAYANIGANLNAENMQRVKFASGSSLLNFKDQSVLKNKVIETEVGDYFLVVGYASTSGDAASNETLSANRATSVASLVNQLKKQGQDVRAVYLGQTKRFSKTNQAENQLCEIWKIRPE